MNVDPVWQKQQDLLKKRTEYEQKQREEISHFNTQVTYEGEESENDKIGSYGVEAQALESGGKVQQML